MQKLEGVLSYLDSWREEVNQKDGMAQEQKIGYALVSKPMMVGTSQVIFLKICYSFTCLIAARSMSQIVASAFLYDQNVTNYTKHLCKKYCK